MSFVCAATLDAESHGTDRVHWVFKNKDQGKTAATASLGMVTLWDVEGGLPQIDKFLYSKDNYVVAGGQPPGLTPHLAIMMKGRCRSIAARWQHVPDQE